MIKDKDGNNKDKKDNNTKKIYVKVAEPNSKDVGRRIARLDPKIAKEIDIGNGDAIEMSS